MKKKEIDEIAQQYIDYLSEYDFSTIIHTQNFNENFKIIFRNYYIILIWGAYVERVYAAENKGRIFFMEAVSDINQAVLLWSHGLYKSCNIVLRSFIENFYRAIGFWLDICDVGKKDIIGLLESVKSSEIIKEDPVYLYHVGRLRQRYVDLCGYVHSSSEIYMEDVHVIGIYPAYHPDKALEFRIKVSEISVSTNAVLCRVLYNVFLRMHYKNRDAVLDALPRRFKKVLFAAGQ